LIDDGVIGEDFFAAINYSHADLMAKIKVNLERLRWLPDFTDNQKDKIIVNIPDYQLFYVQDGDTMFSSRVVVGKAYRQTPVFKAEMGYLVFSPTWTLPQTILWEDVIPSIQKDPSYLKQNNMKVLNFQENEIDYKEVDWESLEDEEDFPYLIRQKPGDENPLGRVKFMFPNNYSIYIHDSPAKHLFSVDERTFSSGCIRMEKAEEFASLLLENAGAWDAEKILEEDIYGMDRKLAEALSLPVSEYFL
jgi:murein L,D-transpeptidase YcbB/YkuD